MSAIFYLAVGVLAALFAAMRIFSWAAAGFWFGAGRARTATAVDTTLAVVGGACLTMLIYASLASAGMLRIAVAADALVAALAVRWQWEHTAKSLRATVRLLLPESRTARQAFAAVLMLLFVIAIGPPRDGDVMHYHLAHIRQIIAARRWVQLPICSYGIPFGWSLTYLPFEWIGIPQAAHFINLGAWLLTSALCTEAVEAAKGVGEHNARNVARWALLATTLLPVVVKAATTAMADAFMILDVALALALLLRWGTAGRSAAAALGFAAFVGLTTRYQALAVSIVVTLIVVVDAARQRALRRLLPFFVVGGVIAVAAALPFYVANELTLGSPIWPFGASFVRYQAGLGQPAAAAQLASVCTTAATSGGAQRLLRSGPHLLIDRTVFPIPLLLVISAAAVLVLGLLQFRLVAIFSLGFLAVWALAQPSLSPRFGVYLVPAAVICLAPVIDGLLATRLRAIVRIVTGLTFGSLGVVAIMYAWDYLRLSATGDVARFHHATWYWPAFDWANQHTPSSSRFVVALYGGNTYPLHRWNVSADPGSSAVIPWESTASACDLMEALARERADYLFYGPNVWTGAPMSAHIDELIRSATRAGLLDSLRAFDVPIVYGRMEGLERRTEVVLYQIDHAAATWQCLPHRR